MLRNGMRKRPMDRRTRCARSSSSCPRARSYTIKAVIESYDNLATLRTEDPRRHRLKLYFAPEMAAEVNALLDSLAGTFSIRRISPA